ncbi:TIGR02206 family membrane protein [Janibacter indicus]|uniref:TIGR02206 family membrane protein n=1 Tax=Janibacter indicus TaxID=857417 RepID=A0A7L9IYH6_9MICO|nr:MULTISPECIES: TIGR02206 family membrane protein [Janibacter]QNF93253.1 TIGR02206 family membrane protein [Janibacter sp. YB324]QOK21853.1 TIGR02206 family membrane protein [Janibacter indicus]
MTGADRFEAMGTSHLAMIGICLVGLPLMVLLGRLARAHPQPVARGFALVLVAAVLPLQVLDHLPGNFQLGVSLPLQLCDLAALVAVIALWTRNHTAICVTYLWGLLLTPQALVTPALAADFPDPRFVVFWAMHILVVWAAVFLTFGLGHRPDWSGYRRTVALTATWMLVLYPLNLLLGTNYGFVNGKPGTGSLLDLLGPWPVYLAVEVVIVALVWALMTWPWTRQHR